MGLKELRLKGGFTLHSLADASGVNFMKIHQIEKGQRDMENITLKTSLKLAKALKCRPEDLIDKEPKA